MSHDMPQDELLQRYEQAKAALTDGLPDQPSAKVHERIMQAAREQADAMNKGAAPADSMPAIGLNHLEIPPNAANDSLWNIKLVASLAVMALSGLLWWQFEHGTAQEQAAAKSAQSMERIAATAPSPAPAPAQLSEAAPAAIQPMRANKSLVSQPASADGANLGAATSAPPSAVASISSVETEPAGSRAPDALPATISKAANATANAAAPSSVALSLDAASATAQASISTGARAFAAPSARAPLVLPNRLFAAIAARDTAALRQSLSEGASPNARSADGQPALHQAVMQRWQEGTDILLAAGADRRAKNNNNQTARDTAIERGFSDIAELLNRR